MEKQREISEEHAYKPDTSTRSEWLNGIHIDGHRAKKQAVEIDNTQNIYFYPDGVLKLWDDEKLLHDSTETLTDFTTGYEPSKLPLPGSYGFKTSAEISIKDQSSEPQKKSCKEVHIHRRYILFSPASLQATKEFKQAICYSLRSSSDSGKYIELQYVFKEFGYYYPYWIITGGRFVYHGFVYPSNGAKEAISKVFENKFHWQAFGGDMDFLRDNIDVKGWLESTATYQDLVMPLDINPIYDLLDKESSSEIQRIYNAQYSPLPPQIDPFPEYRGNTDTLIRLSKIHQKIGCVKGVYFDGSLSNETAVELVNDCDINKIMKITSVANNPCIDCKVRKSALGTNISTHAYLETEFPEESVDNSGFMRGAISHHIKTNGGALQRATRGAKYFAMYVTYGELVFDRKFIKATDDLEKSVLKALNAKPGKEQFKELQEVFGRFGYYYPSVISLGGRITYEIYPNDLPESWLIENGALAIDRALKRDANGIETRVEAIGGGSVITGCQDWVSSAKTNQTRIQFKSMKPIYELLDDNLRRQVKAVYDGVREYNDDFPELPRGLHLDGSEAENQAIELAKNNTFFKMVMLKQFSSQPTVEHSKRTTICSADIGKSSSLDIETNRDLSGTYGFRSGAEGGYNERELTRSSHSIKKETLYHVAYVTCKEMHLYDEFIRATIKFKEAISNALKVGKEDEDTYYALQDVFQKFGYYYPSCTQFGKLPRKALAAGLYYFVGGRITYKPLSENTDEQHKTQKSNMDELFETADRDNVDDGPILREIAEPTKDSQINDNLEQSGVMIATEKTISKELMTTTIANSLTNQTVIQRKGLKPLYDILDEEQRSKVQQVYESIVMTDERICYDYLLEMTSCKRILNNEEQDVAPEVCVSIISIYCSSSGISRTISDIPQGELEQKRACQWGVMLFENENGRWEFQKFVGPEESEHNHGLLISEESKSCGPPLPFNLDSVMNPVIVSLLAEKLGNESDGSSPQFVKYGDIVRVRYVRRGKDKRISPYVHYINSTEDMYLGVHGCDLLDPRPVEPDEKLQDLDFQWKIVYLSGCISRFERSAAEVISEATYATVGWQIQPINQYRAVKESEAFDSEENVENRLFASIKELATDGDPEYQYFVGQAYLYGLRGLDIDISEAVSYLTKASKQGWREAFYELGRLWWQTHEYQKAMHIFEEATHLPVVEVCRELGDIYHSGLSHSNHNDHYNIPQNFKRAFMYYSIGGILGDSKAALTVGAYLEEGYHDDFGVDRNRALRWYEYIQEKYPGALAELAIGKLKHTMANESTDPSEAEVLRQEAYKAFEKAAGSESYARFMMAVYHLNGWGHPDNDPTLGFEILLGLVESGLDLALLGIATCYARGMGVERDPAKASAFQDLAAQMKAQ
ncbi:hypothetical protein DFQ29_001568 [Apophysomyces sp. BC1021]|nr:hypothetical protein DFQ29_001568 [Apophysomyces sp. BC1021]